MQSTNASKSLFVRGDGYNLRLEYTEDYVILHLMDIDSFTKDTFRRMQLQLVEWAYFLKAMGKTHLWAAVPHSNSKIKRLLGGLQFKYEGQSDGMSVYKYEVS